MEYLSQKERKKSCLIKCWSFSVIMTFTSHFWSFFSVYLFFLWCFLIHALSSSSEMFCLSVTSLSASRQQLWRRKWHAYDSFLSCSQRRQQTAAALDVDNFSSVLADPSPAPFFRLLILRGDTLFRLNARRILVEMYY